MRIVAVADTHTFESDLVVPDGDVFIHAGDMCRAGTLDELEGVARWLRSLPHRTKIVVAGNHDGAFQTDHDAAKALLGPDIVYLQDSGIVVDGVRFWGSPWQPTFHDWAFNLPRGEALAAKWALIPDDVDVLVTHGPPAGNGDGLARVGSADRLGCADLARRVREVRPRAHLFGHIHQDGGVTNDDGIVFVNCTTWGMRPRTDGDRPRRRQGRPRRRAAARMERRHALTVTASRSCAQRAEAPDASAASGRRPPAGHNTSGLQTREARLQTG